MSSTASAQQRKPSQTKRQPTEWDEMTASDMADQAVVSKIHTQFVRLSIIQTNGPVKQRLEGLNGRSSRRHTDGRETREKRLSAGVRETQTKLKTRPHLAPVGLIITKTSTNRRLPGGPGVKGAPAQARGTGPIPALGNRTPMLRGHEACAPQPRGPPRGPRAAPTQPTCSSEDPGRS